ncbi:hypothetical protein F4779DRAFT_573600 [Xylariaceae sp. FL0662B]|nr:hypothetical protein F4779DRAFT_573600 [Xylariaceae sp. FL0662B]
MALTPRHDGFHLDPPLYYPPTLKPKSAFDKSSPSFPFYKPPPPVKLSQAAQQPAEQPVLDLPEETSEQVSDETESTQPLIAAELSDQFHILGFGRSARLVAHELAGVPHLPPIKMLAHHPRIMTKWGQEGRTISIYSIEGRHMSSREIACPEYVSSRYDDCKHLPILDNIVVSTESRAIVPSLRALRRRIDRRTTVCLLHPGLGVMEWLNEQVFDDPVSRPNYVLGHTTHKLSRHSDHLYSLRCLNAGQLLLSGINRTDETSELDRATSLSLGRQHTNHLIDLLSATENLGTVGLPWEIFLWRKLGSMVFSSLADTISVVLGCRFNQIREDRHAMFLWDSLLDETTQIIASLPEVRTQPELYLHFTGDAFRKKLRRKLVQQGSYYSSWISLVRCGHNPPVHFLNGYFVRRAEELGVEHKQNSMVMSMVHARLMARRKELAKDVPLGLQPYMMDGDRVGGGQALDDSEPDMDLD